MISYAQLIKGIAKTRHIIYTYMYIQIVYNAHIHVHVYACILWAFVEFLSTVPSLAWLDPSLSLCTCVCEIAKGGRNSHTWREKGL